MDPDCCKTLPPISYEAKIREEMKWYQEENNDGITAHEATLPLEEKQWRSETSHLQTQGSGVQSRSWRTLSRSIWFLTRTTAVTRDEPVHWYPAGFPLSTGII